MLLPFRLSGADLVELKETFKNKPIDYGTTISGVAYEHLPELLDNICRLLDGMKQNLGAAHLMREPHAEGWVLNQLRLVRTPIFTLYAVLRTLRAHGWNKLSTAGSGSWQQHRA